MLIGGLRPYCSPEAAAITRDEGLANLTLIDVLGTPVGWSEWISQHAEATMESFKRLYVDSYTIAADMAAHSVGLCLINDQLVHGSRLQSLLVPPLEGYIEDPGNFYLLQPRDRSLSAAAKAFSGWLKAEHIHATRLPASPSLSVSALPSQGVVHRARASKRRRIAKTSQDC